MHVNHFTSSLKSLPGYKGMLSRDVAHVTQIILFWCISCMLEIPAPEHWRNKRRFAFSKREDCTTRFHDNNPFTRKLQSKFNSNQLEISGVTVFVWYRHFLSYHESSELKASHGIRILLLHTARIKWPNLNKRGLIWRLINVENPQA